MSEYYTPEIEEFHVGFEYEAHSDPRVEDGWTKEEADRFSLKYTIQEDSDVDYRVKYLDKEDIESLGFTDYKHSAYDWYKFNKTIECPIANYNYCGARLLHDRSTSGIIIMGYEYQFELDEDKNAVNLFRGIIKNKSELVKLLKQLGY
jgi:hypothetical protein